jgi:molybdopterin synthase sulfur carrier subunit
MPTGTVRFWAAARSAAGVADETYDAATLADALAAIRDRHGPPMVRLLERCSFVVDDATVDAREPERVPLSEGGVLEVLPPFAGG